MVSRFKFRFLKASSIHIQIQIHHTWWRGTPKFSIRSHCNCSNCRMVWTIELLSELQNWNRYLDRIQLLILEHHLVPNLPNLPEGDTKKIELIVSLFYQLIRHPDFQAQTSKNMMSLGNLIDSTSIVEYNYI